jgi:AraC-like DNA-binding protein
MANTIFSSEGALLFIMVATVALGFWLQRFKVFKTLGPALTVIVMGIVMSNLRIVPTSSPTYDAISGYCVPLSVSICLLSLDLKQMRKLSKEPVIALASAIFSVSEIAQEVGFGDASNFSTRFAKATGQSPLQYRKSALKPQEGTR